MRLLVSLFSVLVVSCTTGYRATSDAFGIDPVELSGARRIYLGEDAHPGMPHVTMDPDHAVRAAERMKREIPDVELVNAPEEAEFIISVLFNSEAACSHCEVGPETRWVAMVERGGPTHETGHPSLRPFLELSGRVGEGFSVTRGFVRQLKQLLRPASGAAG